MPNTGEEYILVQGKQRSTVPVSEFVLKEELPGNDPGEAVMKGDIPGGDPGETVIREDLDIFKAAMSGDLVFVCDPDAVDAEIDDQNAGTAQVIAYDVAGLVGNAGAGDLPIIFTSALLEEPFEVDVALANDADAEAIATAVEGALKDTDAPCHEGTGLFTVIRATAKLTITANDEAANDPTLALEFGTFDGTADPVPSVTEVEGDAVEGVALYTRNVTVTLETADGDRHTWFTGTVPVTIGESVSDDGVASIPTLNPKMTAGIMVIPVTLKDTWTATDTNTLTVSEKEILGYTVAEATSVETSEDTA